MTHDTKVAVVTGAGRGIGAAVAERLCDDGFHVLAVDVDPQTVEALAGRLTDRGGRCQPAVVDVSDRLAVSRLVDAVGDEHGRIDAVVNNAMWIRYGPLAELQEETLDRMFAVGLKGALWMTQAALPWLEKTGGAVVNLSSPAAFRATAGAAGYAAVKGAVTSLTLQMSSELGRLGVRVNAVAPGAVPTEGARLLVDEAGYEVRRARTPLSRLGTPQEIAAAVAWLVSPDASFVNGHVLSVDGGLIVA